jgi:hypothetical protein
LRYRTYTGASSGGLALPVSGVGRVHLLTLDKPVKNNS